MTASEQRRTRERRGHTAEWAAAIALMVKGYRILARREKTPLGEIDLIAVRGRRVAFVEVKRRATREAAEASITAAQRARVRKVAGLWLARNSAYQSYRIGFDIVFCIGLRWPQHLEDAL